MKTQIPSYVRLARARAMAKAAVFLMLIFIIGSVYVVQNINAEAKARHAALAETIEDEFDEEEWDKIENGIHVRTGLVEADGLMAVVTNCTSCHSAQLITQNRMTADRWNETIKWMQEKQGLWELGDNQKIIVDYLVANYPYKKKGRRPQLTNIEWYELED